MNIMDIFEKYADDWGYHGSVRNDHRKTWEKAVEALLDKLDKFEIKDEGIEHGTLTIVDKGEVIPLHNIDASKMKKELFKPRK